MKGYRIVLDTETSGLKNKKNQIYSLSAIVVDQKTDQIVDVLDLKIKPKKGRYPTPHAILTNGLKVYSNEYLNSAITENEAVDRLTKLSEKYVVAEENRIIKPVLLAQNTEFDKFFISIAMSRAGHKIQDHFNKSELDTLKMARRMKGKFETKSNKLSDLADALGVKYDKSNLHTSLADTMICEEVYKKLVELQTGKAPKNLDVNPQFFEEGEVYRIQTNSKKSGIKERHVKVLKNSEDDSKLIAIDLDDYVSNKNKFNDSTIREFNYSTIIAEKVPFDESIDLLNAIHLENKDKIDSILASKEDIKPVESIFDNDVSDFELISGVEGVLANKEMSLEEIVDVLAGQNIDPKSVSAILTKANELNLAKGGEGILPDNDNIDNEIDDLKRDFKIILSDLNPNELTENQSAVVSYFSYLTNEFPEKFSEKDMNELKKKFSIKTEKTIITESGPRLISSKCKICGREISNKDSIIDGIGKECLSKAGRFLKAS